MGDGYTLLVRPVGPVGVQQLVADADRATGEAFQAADPNVPDELVIPTTNGALILDLDSDYEDDGGLPLSRFRWSFDLDEPSDPSWARVARQQMGDLYDGLVATGRYECLLVHDFVHVLATNVPGLAATSTDSG
jgi:hypothetical protein